MLVEQARNEAADWVAAAVAARADVVGAFFSGSTVQLEGEAELPASSDVDVVLVLDREQVPVKPGKFRQGGILLEVTYLPVAELVDPEAVARSYVLAASFAFDTIIYDPTGILKALQDRVASDFADPAAVRRRVDGVRSKIMNALAAFDTNAPWHQQVSAWLFPSSLPTHAILVAGLANPTVRLRYPAARRVLEEHELSGLYPELLGLIGCLEVEPSAVRHHLEALAISFDQAASVARTPFFFSTDITPEARVIAIDGSQQLIDHGEHQEAVFWIVATFARCQQILRADAPGAVVAASDSAFRDAVVDLCGMRDPADLAAGAESVRRFWPVVSAATEEIIGS